MDNLFVIIVTYNGEPWIRRCLDSVYDSTIQSTVVVIDNQSTDNTTSIIKEFYPSAILLKNHTNIGFGRANNIGIEYALKNKADYVYLLNQDAWIDPDVFETMIDIQKRKPKFGILSPMQMNASRDKFDNYFGILTLGKNTGNILADIYLNKLEEVYEVEFVMAAHWLISRECIEHTGGFSPIFSHYGEDNDFIHRIHYHGFKSGVCPHLKATHDRETRIIKPSEMFSRKYRSSFLVEINDINQTLIRAILKAYSTFFKDEITYMVKYASFKPLIYLFKSLLCIHKVIRNRRIAKAGNLCFLNLNNYKQSK